MTDPIRITEDRLLPGGARLLTADPVDPCSLPAAELSGPDRRRFQEITHPGRAAEWLSTRLLLQKICDKAFLEYGLHGEPLLRNCPEWEEISVSHCRGQVALLLANVPCGIDIEPADRDFRRAADRFLNDSERERMPETLYGAAWCAKEACYKLLRGEGIVFLNELEIGSFDPGKMEVKHDGRSFTVQLLSQGRYRIACVATI